MRNSLTRDPLVTFAIATRKRIKKLTRCIQSFIDTADDPCCLEVVVRIARDDLETIDAIQDLMDMCQLRVVIGYPLDGYPACSFFIDEASRLGCGQWTWGFDDDMVMQGKGWDTQLRTVPMDGYIVQPEIEQLNTSKYHNHEGGANWCVPNCAWRRFGFRFVEFPSDVWLDNLLRVQHGWKTRFLSGITIWHDRDKSGEP